MSPTRAREIRPPDRYLTSHRTLTKLDDAIRKGAGSGPPRGWRLKTGGRTSSTDPGWAFRPLASDELDSSERRPEWLVEGCLVRQQPAVLAGPTKTLKTSVGVDLGVSLAAGKPFLGSFPVPTATRVVVISGESGEAAVLAAAQRVCDARGVRLEDLGQELLWQFDVPQLGRPGDLAALAAGLAAARVGVVILDPVYLTLLAGDGGRTDERSIYSMGRHLQGVARACTDAGATPVLVHHAHRRLEVGRAMGLGDLAFAGLPEFARQWLLLNRRAEYAGDGEHELILSVGGSAGHGGVWDLTVSEGVMDDQFGGRRWDVSVTPRTNTRHRAKRADQRDQVLAAVEALQASEVPGVTKEQLSKRLRRSYASLSRDIDQLLSEHALEAINFKKQCGRAMREVTGYRRPVEVTQGVVSPPEQIS